MTTTFQLLNSLKMGVTLRDVGKEEVGTSKKERKELDLYCKASFEGRHCPPVRPSTSLFLPILASPAFKLAFSRLFHSASASGPAY